MYIGVHDGHGGTETSEFLKEHLYYNLKSEPRSEAFTKQCGLWLLLIDTVYSMPLVLVVS